MNIFLQLILINLILVYIIDKSSFIRDITTKISGWLTRGKVEKPFSFKPFTCSLCMATWITIGYLIAFSSMDCLQVLSLALLSGWVTKWTYQIFITIEMLIDLIISKIQKLIER